MILPSDQKSKPFFQKFPSESGKRFILMARSSRSHQRDNCLSQVIHLMEKLFFENECELMEVYAFHHPARVFPKSSDDIPVVTEYRRRLQLIGKACREHEAILLVVHPNRIVRHRCYGLRNRSQPTLEEIQEAVDLLGNVPIETLLDPSASETEALAFFREINLECEKLKSPKTGRLSTWNTKQVFQPWAMQLHQQGKSLREIQSSINDAIGWDTGKAKTKPVKSCRTILDWLNEANKNFSKKPV